MWLLAMLPLAASAQSLVQRCAGYAGRIEALCSRVPTSCPGVNDHPCLAGRGTASYEQYLAVCLAGRVGEPEFQRDLGTAQALVDNCRPGITPLPPVTSAPQRPCPSELVVTHQRLQDEAAQLRAEIDLQRRQPINPGPDLARRAAAAQSAVTEAASLLDMVAPAPELGGMAGELKQARVLTEEVAARAPTSAEALLRMLEERQRVVGHQIFAVRERAESQGCVLPVPRPPAPATATAPRRVAVTPSGAVLAHQDRSDHRAAEAIGWVTAFARLAQEDAEARELRARQLKFWNDSGATTIDTGRSTQGSEVTTPEGSVRSERTLYVVARDASRQATFVYVREGQVSATPLRGTALSVSAGQGALLTATGLRLLTVATAVGPAMEDNTDRRGSDYANFDLPAAQPQLCRERCEGDANCRAWTYVKPGVQGANARCWLKNPAPAPVANHCCVSGTISTAAPPLSPTQPVRMPNGDIRYDRPTIEGVAVDHCASWATHCGQGGADAYCRHHGHPRAVSFRVHSPGRTWVLADRRVCEGGNCVGFSEVVCAGHTIAPPPPPQPPLPQPPAPASPPPITQLTCWDWSGQLKNGAVVRSKVEMSPNGTISAPAWGMRGTIRNIGGNRYQVAWNGRGPGQEDNLVMDAAGVLSGSNFETNWIRAERTPCDGAAVGPPPLPPTQPVRLPNGDIRYDRPAIEGIAVDHCASWATHCGQGGADAYCRHHGHPRAVSFRVHNPGRTWVLADRRVCEGGNCVGFSEVVCAGHTVAPPPPPQPPPPQPPLPQPPAPASPPPITQLTCWDWSGQLKNGAVVRSKVEMSPNGAMHAPAWGMRGTIRHVGGNRYQVAWNGRGPGQEDNLVMDAAGVLSGSNFETHWIRAVRMNC